MLRSPNIDARQQQTLENFGAIGDALLHQEFLKFQT